jgi:hypothetical protein
MRHLLLLLLLALLAPVLPLFASGVVLLQSFHANMNTAVICKRPAWPVHGCEGFGFVSTGIILFCAQTSFCSVLMTDRQQLGIIATTLPAMSLRMRMECIVQQEVGTVHAIIPGMRII